MRHLAPSSRLVGGAVWKTTRRPPAGDSWISVHPTLLPTGARTPRIAHEEGEVVRGLTVADLPRERCVSDNARAGPYRDLAAGCRGARAGVTQFVVTNEHNMIMPSVAGRSGPGAIQAFSPALLARASATPRTPPSCALSFVHVCQYVTDRYTDPPALGPGYPVSRPKLLVHSTARLLKITNNARNSGGHL